MDGLAEKQMGLALVERNGSEFLETMRQHARAISMRQGFVSSDDLRRVADQKGIEPHHPNAWGAVFKGRGWRKDGRIVSRYPSTHGREIYRWVWMPEPERVAA